jgi:hypothetical protein
MLGLVPRVGFLVGLGLSLVGGAMTLTMPVAAQGCDPSYPEICLAASPDLVYIDNGHCSSGHRAWRD